MTRAEFQSSEPMMAQLDEVLRFPIVKNALEIVRAEGANVSLPVPISGVDYAAQVAAVGARTIGWADAIKALCSLSRKPLALQQHKPNDQNSMYLDEARKRVVASGIYTEEELKELNKQ